MKVLYELDRYGFCRLTVDGEQLHQGSDEAETSIWLALLKKLGADVIERDVKELS